MWRWEGIFLLAAGIVFSAASASIAHDSVRDVGLRELRTPQRQLMTSSLMKNATLRFADETLDAAVGSAAAGGADGAAAQQFNLGRNLFNLERQQQQQRRQQKQQQEPQHPNIVAADVDGDMNAADKGRRAVTRISPSNVVQDWSLVCKELCGANLAGVPCIAQCAQPGGDTVRNVGSNLKLQLGKNKALICKELCEQNLGGSVCGCKKNAEDTENQLRIEFRNMNSVCESFCRHARYTLNGCSPCIEIVEPIELLHHSAINALQDGPAPTTTTTTTPNWDELCASLCKTGDGGSLCNCDLSPFIK